MTAICRHNPILQHRLATLLQAGDAAQLLEALQGLSNKEARTAGYLLGEVLLPGLPDGAAFWQFFLPVVSADSKAYLGTFLKAALRLYEAQRLTFDSPQLTAFAAECTPVDREKVIKAALPVLRSPEEAQHLLRIFGFKPDKHSAFYLLQGGTAVCYYLLFNTLKVVEEESILQFCCKTLVRKGDTLSFNMASILCQYFDLKDVPGVFSLHVEPYKFSRLDLSFESFRNILLQ